MKAEKIVSGRLASAKMLLKEPLTVFMVLAVAIFIFDTLKAIPEQDDEMQAASPGTDLGSIVVTRQLKNDLEEEFAWLEGRQPTAEESEELLQDWLHEEMIFRHALMQEMHLRDGKMREHLVEKVRLLWAGLPDEPSQSDVLNYYMEHIGDYYSEPRVSFTQVFYDAMPVEPEAILARLCAGEAVAGDGYWLGDDFEDYSESILRTSFGGDFYLALVDAPPEQWIGPLESPRGYHYVKVSEVTASHPLQFEDVYERVRMSIMDAEQRRRIDERVEAIRDAFSIELDQDDV